MSTSASRTVRIPDENRLVFVSAFDKLGNNAVPMAIPIIPKGSCDSLSA